MRKTSAPARNRFAMTLRSDDAGPSVATILVRRRRRISSCFATAVGRPEIGGGGTSGTRDCSGCERRCSADSVSCTVQDGCSPVSTSKIAGAVEAARKAILGAADGELLVARAHESLSRPFAAAVIVDRVDVVVARDQRAAQQRLAAPRRQVPPALGGPALVLLVAERNPDPAAGIVAEPEIGGGRARPEMPSCAVQDRGADNGIVARLSPLWSVARSSRPLCHGAGYRVNLQELSTRMARKSLTLV